MSYGNNKPYTGTFEDIPERFVPIILNRCYGGAHLSSAAARALGRTFYEKDEEDEEVEECFDGEVDNKFDLDVARYILRHGTEAGSGRYSSLTVYLLPAELKPYVHVQEYDGLEDLDFRPKEIERDMFFALLNEQAVECPQIAAFLTQYNAN